MALSRSNLVILRAVVHHAEDGLLDLVFQVLVRDLRAEVVRVVPRDHLEHLQGKIHRVDPDFGSTLTASNRDSQSNCWVNWKIMGQPCEFQVCGIKLKIDV
jgi:hypothetical protein